MAITCHKGYNNMERWMIMAMPENKNNVPFYLKHGFSVMENGVAIQLCNYENKR